MVYTRAALAKRRNAAARKIQKKWLSLPRNNVTFNLIRDPYHVMWFKNANRKHFSRYATSTYNQLRIHPETRAPKRKQNVLVIPTRGVRRNGVAKPMLFPPSPRRAVPFRGSFGYRVAGTPGSIGSASPARRTPNRRASPVAASSSVVRRRVRRVRRRHTAPRSNTNLMISAGFGSPNRS
jgi:hypothetical protein